MGIIIDPEMYKPLKCKECGGSRIAKMMNEGVIRCLDCGKEKDDPNHVSNILKREMGSGANVFERKTNPNPYRDF